MYTSKLFYNPLGQLGHGGREWHSGFLPTLSQRHDSCKTASTNPSRQGVRHATAGWKEIFALSGLSWCIGLHEWPLPCGQSYLQHARVKGGLLVVKIARSVVGAVA